MKLCETVKVFKICVYRHRKRRQVPRNVQQQLQKPTDSYCNKVYIYAVCMCVCVYLSRTTLPKAVCRTLPTHTLPCLSMVRKAVAIKELAALNAQA